MSCIGVSAVMTKSVDTPHYYILTSKFYYNKEAVDVDNGYVNQIVKYDTYEYTVRRVLLLVNHS